MIQKLKPWTGINLKVIERVGEKLEDLIHQSNPWENVDCNRVDCFTCQSSARSEDMKFKSCKKRSVVYQTWCQTCLDIKKLNDKPDCELDCEPSVNLGNMVNDQKVNYCEDSESKKLQKLELEGAEHMEAKDEIDKQDNRLVVGGIINVETEMLQNEKLVKNAKNAKISKKRGREIEQNGPLYLYIGETSRSAYERGQEHLKDFEFKRTKSHYLRHAVECHPTVQPEKLKFKMKILSCHRSAFERQIREAVMIDIFSGPNLMNSKIEYSRCALPKITLNMGNKQQKEDPLVSKEKSTLDKIRLLYKKENKRAEIEVLDMSENTENLGCIGSKKARLDSQAIKSPEKSNNLGTAEMGTQLDVIDVDSMKRSPSKKPKKKLRSEVKFKVNSGKRSPVPKLEVKKGSPVPKLEVENGSPVPVLGTENESPSQVSDTGIGSATPNSGTNFGSPVPISGADKGLPEPELGDSLRYPDPVLEINGGLQDIPVPIADAENGPINPDFEAKSKSVASIPNRLSSELPNSGVLSPSLKPVRIKNLIKIFEENTNIDIDKNCQKSSKVKVIDAFEKIMSTNGVGDTPKKTPKRKRISSNISTGKNGNVLEKWLNRATKM